MSNDFCTLPTEIELTANNRLTFEHVLQRVPRGGRVLDLGCGSLSHYWALAYADRVDEVVSVDVNRDSIDMLQTTLNALTPDFLNEHYRDTLDYLGLDATAATLVLLSVMRQQDRVDFRHALTNGPFDTIIALESIECVDTFDELVAVLRNVRDSLASNGKFIGIVTPYDEVRGYVNELTALGIDGRLNPGERVLREAFAVAQFPVEINTYDTGIDNYPTSIVFQSTG